MIQQFIARDNMRKIGINLLCIASILTSTSVFAANKVGLAVDQGLGVVVQFGDLATLTASSTDVGYINAFIGNDGFSVDYIFKQGDFSEDIPFNWYLGGGAYYNWAHHDNIGARVPLGLTLPFAKRWDVYGQLSPALDVDMNDDKLRFELDLAIGIRYEF